jgi:CRP-like cAMP-binding protein
LLSPDDDLHSGNGRDDAAKCCVYLWSLGETVLFDDGEITVQGTRQDDLLIVLEGVVEVRRDGEVITHLGPGDFLGEMSFVTGDRATAGSRAIGLVRARSWEHARVEALAPHEHSDEELAREERQRWWGRF